MGGVVTSSRLERLRSLLAQVQHAIRVEEAEERERDAMRRRPPAPPKPETYDQKRQRVHAPAVRAWARANGYELGNRGRVPEHVIDHYLLEAGR